MNHQVKRRRVPIHGVLLLDKPAGMSSTQALAKAKWLLNAEKAGHTGTLDPFATGLLPLCFGEATKYASDLLDADKSYEATVRLGVTTSTGDTEGEVVETREVQVTPEQISRVLFQFSGKISQTPPMYSALKVEGKPLYAYAREGITLERKAREVLIHEIELVEFDVAMLKIRVRCSKGTYMRVLGEDIGKTLGCGAHLTQLRRTGIAHLSVAEAIQLSVLQENGEPRSRWLRPVDSLTSMLPAVQLNEDFIRRFMHGQRLPLGRALSQHSLSPPLPEGRVRVLGPAGSFAGTAVVNHDQVLIPERVVSITA
ncbi:MAG: tRNA pseudouridine(55) synthase TruB [Oxalobacteraceae bacterium]